MRIESKDAEFEGLVQLAKSICVAARTAPKACGTDVLDTLILTGDDKAALSATLRELGSELGNKGALFIRDADCVDKAQVLVLFGAKEEQRDLNEICKLCGFDSCADCEAAGAACVYPSMDLGIALGSAVSMAARDHADNRIFFTAGMAARRMKLMQEYTLIMGLPLYAGGKNPFFDRGEMKPGK